MISTPVYLALPLLDFISLFLVYSHLVFLRYPPSRFRSTRASDHDTRLGHLTTRCDDSSSTFRYTPVFRDTTWPSEGPSRRSGVFHLVYEFSLPATFLHARFCTNTRCTGSRSFHPSLV
ncbi:hypothetical protein EJ02DRAFT_162236 [Clathrospora elynae]|uniref:Uncharacterized protein n=1 Tax=Clathrospora elynae TaxID=706981 RepID=A0A6A5SSD3_9PLEO|nr:hypothetical protein EJ02DRAFT_162236 [Clathrospora elynae]